MEIKGIVNSIKKQEAKNGKTYATVKIGEKVINDFKNAMVYSDEPRTTKGELVHEGDKVTMEVTEKGKYLNGETVIITEKAPLVTKEEQKNLVPAQKEPLKTFDDKDVMESCIVDSINLAKKYNNIEIGNENDCIDFNWTKIALSMYIHRTRGR